MQSSASTSAIRLMPPTPVQEQRRSSSTSLNLDESTPIRINVTTPAWDSGVLSTSADSTARHGLKLVKYNSIGSGASTKPPISRSSAWDEDSRMDSVAEIGANYMRVSGAIEPFKGVLSAPSSSEYSKQPLSATAALASSMLTPTATLMTVNSEGNVGGPKYRQICSTTTNGVQATTMFVVGGTKAPNVGASDEDNTSCISVGRGGRRKSRGNISYRLSKQKELCERRRKVCDYALAFALMGIAMMVLENEMTSGLGGHVYEKASYYSNALKTLIVVSTLILLVHIVVYHVIEVQLFMLGNGVEDWRIAVTSSRLVQLAAELVCCGICPFPSVVPLNFTWRTVHADGKTVTATDVSVDVLLSIPMFLRLYLICRVMLLHSKLFTDATRSIGALNRISFNFRFVVKTYMTLCPGRVLLIFTASFCVVASWILRLCERHHTGPQESAFIDAAKHDNFLNSMWMIAITFLTIGYGDIVPNTYCGRAVAVCTGIMGVGVSSLVVAVIASKLELSMAEKHVHNFMMDSQLTKRLKHAAANVLRETWLIYRSRKPHLTGKPINSAKIRFHQRKFLMAIYELRQVKQEQRKLQENSLTLSDVAKITSQSYELSAKCCPLQETAALRLTLMEERLARMEDQVDRGLSNIANEIHGLSSALADKRRLSSDTVTA